MPYRIDVRQADQAALLRLLALGPLDAEFHEDGRAAAVMPDAVTPAQVAAALGLPGVAVSPVRGADADSVWRLGPRPIRVGRVRLVPDGSVEAPAEPDDVRLVETTAFGTGLHPTTTLCVEIIGELVQVVRLDALLDVGTGSGILALVALRLGVPAAVAIDIDTDAVRAAIDNAARNDLTARLRVVQGGPEALSARWPLVVANVLAAPLVEMAPALAARVGRAGRLVLSGIATGVQPDVERAYRRLGMHVADARVRDGWVAIVLNASW